VSAAPPAVARCERVSRTFGSGPAAVVALHEVTCQVGEGGLVAIVGPSGSGKSTLLHLLAGLDSPSRGLVDWPALGPRARLRPGPVAVVFQGPSLIPTLDVVENVSLPLLLAGAGLAEARAAAVAALERLGCGPLAAQLPEELSGGQAQRVAIARALAGRPRLLLADEPTGQLDVAAGRQVVDALLLAARELGAALVISTHDPAVPGRLDTTWRLEDGRLAA
jgi:putative ABC transport system ATP-binding protein